MLYINKNVDLDGSHGPVFEDPKFVASSFIIFPDKFMPIYYPSDKRAAGFVTIEDDGTTVTSCVWDEEAYQEWCEANPEQPSTGGSSYIPTPEQSAVVMMRSVFYAQVADMDDDQIIQCSGLADDWAPGDHKTREVYNANDQTWECFSAYNNAEHPDVTPSDPSWFTFNRPLHGKSVETARPWVKPQHGTTDIYHIGEYMVYTDGNIYKCKRDTNFSPDEYAPDWEVYNG